jgi:hypothetical protein
MVEHAPYSGGDYVCRKCGATAVVNRDDVGAVASVIMAASVEFCAKTCERTPDGTIDRVDLSSLGSTYDETRDHLHRICRVCGYETIEAVAVVNA